MKTRKNGASHPPTKFPMAPPGIPSPGLPGSSLRYGPPLIQYHQGSFPPTVHHTPEVATGSTIRSQAHTRVAVADAIRADQAVLPPQERTGRPALIPNSQSMSMKEA